jgi:hypothetical protein
MKWFLILLLYSCASVGPNYNQGGSHNDDMAMRNKIVFKEDLRVKNKMVNARSSARKSIHKAKKIRNKKLKKYI